ncbi:O-antigen ligase family protein [Actinomycetospora soli]|uniref:O-antigen ligase family protein n=1 Tax=Actinomycetospora soli TaxID=2893887 RepID=UPI001E5F561F|nr:O-antigen ligase family protein [Actinomycetospora soli]MCD2187834.1 O-antigen ligase family protein [Actinomycetospora soli]
MNLPQSRPEKWLLSWPEAVLAGILLLPLVVSLFAVNRFQSAVSGDSAGLQGLVDESGSNPLSPYAPVIALSLVAALCWSARRNWRSIDLGLAGLATLSIVTVLLTFVSLGEAPSLGQATVALTLVSIGIAAVSDGVRLRHVFVVVAAIFSVASWVYAVVAPSLAVETGYTDDALFSGIPYRLFGLAPHANSLGAVSAVGLILVFPWKRHLPLAGLFALTLLATQSKTSVVALGIGCVAAVVAYRAKPLLSQILLVGVFLMGPLLVLLTWVNRLSSEPLGPVLGTLTGRTEVWIVTLDEVDRTWLFGVGSGLWDYNMKSRYIDFLGFAPGQSHNEFLQSLGVHGLPGVLLLIALLIFLLRALGAASSVTSRGTLAGLAAFFLFRGTTESILPGSFTEVNVYVLVVTLWAALVASRGGRAAHMDPERALGRESRRWVIQ